MKKNASKSQSIKTSPGPDNRRVVLVTGGARSGKSRFAQELAENDPGDRVFIATCPKIDPEMSERIERHRASRADKGWDTIEEPLDLKTALERARSYKTVVVDCLTLWINNLLWAENQSGEAVDEDLIENLCAKIEETLRVFDGTVVFVTNEVGMGLVPADPVSRRFRDLAGRCNQEIAAFADDVVLMTAGIPLYVKRSASR